MKLKRALSQIKPTDGQRDKIYGDIMEKLSEENTIPDPNRRRVFSKKRIGVPAAVCALVLICGITVSAANFGWGHKLFGSSAAIIERDIYDYSVEIGNVKIENAEGVPYNFTVGDVISDGESLYFNLLVEGMTIEPDWAGYWGTVGSAYPINTNGTRLSTTCWYELGMDENTADTAVFVNYTNAIKKGDVLEFEFRENIETDENGAVLSMLSPLLATVSFEIQSDVNNARKTIDINRTAVFKDRPEPSFAEIETYDEDKISAVELNIESISISPLSYVITATADLSQPVTSSHFAHGWGNVWFILKNGEKICFPPDYMGSDSSTGEYVISMLSNFSPRYGILDLNEIEAIEFDGFTVSFVSDEAVE